MRVAAADAVTERTATPLEPLDQLLQSLTGRAYPRPLILRGTRGIRGLLWL